MEPAFRRLGGLRRPVVAAVAFGLMLGSPGAARADTLTPFIALLNGGQEVPARSSPSQGMAFLTYNKQVKLLCYSISFSPLTTAELVAHFHGPAAPGQNADILFDISPSPSPLGSPKTGCVGPFEKPQEKALNRGLLYINIHSAMFPGGEIRGQVLPVKGVKFEAPAIVFSPSGAFLDAEPLL
jgi:hypothetical protein